MVLVTHFMDEAAHLCDRIAIVVGGRIAALDTPDGLIASYGGRTTVRFSASDADLDGLDRVAHVDAEGDAAMVIASMGIIGLPVHLAGYRECGVLRRFRASALPAWSVLGAHAVVTVVLALIGSGLLVAVAFATHDVTAPHNPAGVMGSFVLATASFVAIGMLLGTLLRTARAAQGAGIMLWFVMLIVGGAGPPREDCRTPCPVSATCSRCATRSRCSRTRILPV